MLKFYRCTESFFTIEGTVDKEYAISPDRVRYFTEGNYYTETEIGDCKSKFERTSFMFEAIDNRILRYNTLGHIHSSRVLRRFKRDLDLSMNDDMTLVTIRRAIARLDHHMKLVKRSSVEHMLLIAECIILQEVEIEFDRIIDVRSK